MIVTVSIEEVLRIVERHVIEKSGVPVESDGSFVHYEGDVLPCGIQFTVLGTGDKHE